jgi:hypothetical protein
MQRNLKNSYTYPQKNNAGNIANINARMISINKTEIDAKNVALIFIGA